MRIRYIILFCFFHAVAFADFLGNYTSHDVLPGSVVIHAGTPVVTLTPYSDNIMRVSYFPDGQMQTDTSFVVIRVPEAVPMQVESSDSVLTVTMANLTVRIRKNPVRLSFLRNGVTLLADEGGFFWQGAEKGLRYRLTEYESLYGCGERAESFDHRGQRLISSNTAQYCYGAGQATMNITIPLVISSQKYGVYFEDTYPAYFDFGAAQHDIFEYGVSDGKLSYFLMTGGSYPAILRSYSFLTGTQPLPPRWALGFLQSRFGYESETQARAVVQAFRQQHIPLDGIILDLYWFGWGRMGNLSWDASHWANPQQMMQDFDSQGVKTILITEPYIQQTSSNYNQTYSNGYLTPDSNGIPVIMPDFWAGTAGLLDITNPDAANWFWNQYQTQVNLGVGGWWSDLGEPELHPANMVHVGGSAQEIHNVYSLLWAKLLHDKYQQSFPDKRLFNLIRSGYAGMQRYSAFPWSGDVQRTFSGLQAQIPILLGMGMSGVGYEGSDLGGFSCGNQDAELYTRWLQFGAFCPIMRAHGVDIPTEPVYWDSSTKAIVTDYIRLRYSLLPYNYTLTWENHTTGMPLARPICFDSSAQSSASNMQYEYFWGPSFLVAPVLNAGQTQRTVYLPGGYWIDYWTEQAYNGLGQITTSAPLNRLPLFVKAGSIIPMIPPIETTRDYSTDTMIVHFYPHVSAPVSEYTLYNDDGQTPNAVESGQYETVHFSGATSSNMITMLGERDNRGYAGAPPSRKIILAIHGIHASPSLVGLGFSAIPWADSWNDFMSRDSVVYWNPIEARLYMGFTSDDNSFFALIFGDNLLSVPDPNPSPVADFRLEPGYPNPFNSSTTITYSIPRRDFVSLKVYNLLGAEVATLINATSDAGVHTCRFHADGLSSGIYFCKLVAGGQTQIQKLILIR